MAYIKPIKYLSDANQLHIYSNDDNKYFIIGKKSYVPNCTQLHKVNCDKVGNNCITTNNLLKDWLRYNENYQLFTTLFLDVGAENNKIDINNEKYVNAYYPDTHYSTSLQKLMNAIPKSEVGYWVNVLINYYYYLGIHLFNNDLLIVPDPPESPPHIKQLYETHCNVPDMVYLEQYDDIKMYAQDKYNAIYQKIKATTTIKTFYHQVQPLFDLLNVVENISFIILYGKNTQIVYTDNPHDYTDYFDLTHLPKELNVVTGNNCISPVPTNIPVDEFRWSLYRTKQSGSIKMVNVKNFNGNIRLTRSGVILYTYHNNKLYFGFGVDKVYNEFSDFGGKIESGENVIETAIRELNEESLGLFQLTKKDIDDSLMLYNDNMAIIFVKFDADVLTINDDFQRLLTKAKKYEVKAIVWLSYDELQQEIKKQHSKIYNLVKLFLLQAGNFYDKL